MLLQGLLGARGPANVASRARQAQRDDAAADPEVLFFVHIPKCAGSSFRQTLKRWFGQGALFLDTHDARTLKTAVDRLVDPPRAIAGHIPFGLHEGLPLRACYVGLVRHPLDRFVSLYRHARRTTAHSLHPAAARLELEAFYDFSLKDARARGSTVAVQCYFLSRERTFEAARAVIDRSYALVAPVERYGEFVAACAERFGCSAPEIPARNVGDEAPESTGALETLRQRITVDHAEDLRLFDYVGETFDARRGSLSFALHV